MSALTTLLISVSLLANPFILAHHPDWAASCHSPQTNNKLASGSSASRYVKPHRVAQCRNVALLDARCYDYQWLSPRWVKFPHRLQEPYKPALSVQRLSNKLSPLSGFWRLLTFIYFDFKGGLPVKLCDELSMSGRNLNMRRTSYMFVASFGIRGLYPSPAVPSYW